MLKEDSRVRFDGEPSVGRGHRPVLSNADVLGNEGPLVGFIADMFDHGVRNHEIEGAFGERQVPSVGDHKIAPGDRVLGAPIEAFKQDAAGHEEVDGSSHAVCDDVLERLVLSGLHAHNEHTAGAGCLDDGFESVGLAVAVKDAEPAGRSRDEVAHSGSLWQAMVAKPLTAFFLAVVCFGAAACSPVSTQGADRQSAPEPDASVAQPATPSAPTPTSAESTAAEQSNSDDQQADDPNAAVIAEEDDDERGSRVGSDEEPAALAPTSTPAGTAGAPTPDPEPAVAPTPTPGPAGAEPTVTEVPPTSTAVPTTAPVQVPQPLATAAPAATAAPVPTASQDPDAAFTAPAPTGPVPSDDIVVQGPDVDESEPVIISDSGATACALAESAIDFLDVGDLSRAASVLQEASTSAAQASEPEIAGTAPELAAAGANEDAAVAAIIAMLNACAIHGYQV